MRKAEAVYTKQHLLSLINVLFIFPILVRGSLFLSLYAEMLSAHANK